MGEAHGSWSLRELTLWLAKYEKLINKAKQYDKPF